jgi:hypothetical protein
MLSRVLSYPFKPRNPFVVDSDQDLLWDLFEDPADLGKNVFRRTRCESGHLALEVSKQEEIAECTFWRISRMGSLLGLDRAISCRGRLAL